MSPRNSAAATAKLLADVGCHQVLTTPVTLAALWTKVQQVLQQTGHVLATEEMPSTETVFPKLGQETAAEYFRNYEPTISDTQLSSVAFDLHSSGSTGFPKTIPQTQQMDNRPSPTSAGSGATILPAFHTLSIYFQLLVPLVGLCIVSIASTLEHAQTTGCNSIVIIPAILEIWASNEDAVVFLRRLSLIVLLLRRTTVCTDWRRTYEVGGSAQLSSVYGATELGALVHTVLLTKDLSDGDWAYVRFDSRANIRWVPRGDVAQAATYGSRLGQFGVGLDSDTIQLLKSSKFIFRYHHTAWRLDFNLNSISFEPQIMATMNLINFVTKDVPVLESVINDSEVVLGDGYGEAKYIIERLLEMSDARSTSFRIGQICGGPPVGAWSTTEWFPVLVKSSMAMGMFPVFSGAVS
ncbi:hypothetical protein C8R44DRAFT_981308 [Mycena epipterygia]|nr:hypothetical protein C8R44DRAFT_981308 [Mycena epipterygia]